MKKADENNSQSNSSALYTDRAWLRIDNASNLYAASRTKSWCRTYRISLIFDEDILPEILQKAAAAAAKRFPSFCVKLRDGFFWSYLERTDEMPLVRKEQAYPYRPIKLTNTLQPCFRLLYYGRRLTLEGFHSVSDGGGSLKFLSTVSA